MNQSIEKRESPIPFHRPYFTQEEEEAVLRILRSGWLTTGSESVLFEEELAQFYGMKHAIALSSATAALFLSLEGLGVGPDDFVIVPTYTFAATANVVEHLKANCLFVDSKEDYNLDIEEVKKIVESHPKRERIKAIIAVHFAGRSADIDSLRSLNIPIVEDGAHSFPFRRRDEGFRGESLVLSFYATKTLATGEGGVLLTDSDDLAKRAKMMRLHGIDRDVWQRYQKSDESSWGYDILFPGYKMNFPDILAGIGRIQLARGEEMFRAREKIAAYYNEHLGGLSGVQIPPPLKAGESHSHHLYPLRLTSKDALFNLEESQERRRAVMERLTQKKIGFSVHFIPLHTMTFYRQKYQLKENDFPVAYRLFQESISLPIFVGMTQEEQRAVVEAIKETVSWG